MANYTFRNLVFEGGGVKGIAYGGALKELEHRGILSGIERVAGASAGAITAVLLAVGYNYKEVSDIVAETNFNDFADDSLGVVRDANRFLNDFGWHEGEVFRRWIGNLIRNKTGKKDLTFRELQTKSNSKELYLVVTNLSDQVAEVFSHKTTPDVAVRDAVRMSMSIPLYFKCVRYGSDKDIMVDGGVTWNYPVNIFDHESYLSNPDNGEKVTYNTSDGYEFNHETLGFRLDAKDEIAANKNNWSNVPKDIDNILNYAVAMIGFMRSAANKRHLHKNDWNRTIFIDSLDVTTTDFDLSREKINALLESGERGVNAYFDWRDNDAEFNKKPS
ncbi:patatin-like phospholipase family protein [Enterovibrio sp. ZSDZ35]|uniref:Patatin-like phospholipase family protein n=1 Tax=Enterovibrio qingdaonensis TaxID=2899818 RepID=A0ABT5QG97_9GAMM|nr:patatin-like phospholipase family protein [Enterovibrio sp. ZSDZ35]MDD1779991.1 patatin-like phospholipase family protein [Enterovibrio sp. ZSDZ35]